MQITELYAWCQIDTQLMSPLLFSATRKHGSNLHRTWKSAISKQNCPPVLRNCVITFISSFFRQTSHQNTSLFIEKTANISWQEKDGPNSPKKRLKEWDKHIRAVLCLSHIPVDTLQSSDRGVKRVWYFVSWVNRASLVWHWEEWTASPRERGAAVAQHCPWENE